MNLDDYSKAPIFADVNMGWSVAVNTSAGGEGIQ
jgi:hypothetical protein